VARPESHTSKPYRIAAPLQELESNTTAIIDRLNAKRLFAGSDKPADADLVRYALRNDIAG
jgi:hypothetical protein